jgi:hypothetical protein
LPQAGLDGQDFASNAQVCFSSGRKERRLAVNRNFISKITIICGSGWTERYFPASSKPRSLATILLAGGFFW